LTEGEKFIIVFISSISAEEAAEYTLVSNFTATYIRLIIAPLEESAFNVFGSSQSYSEEMKFMADTLHFELTVSILSCILSYHMSHFTL